MMRVRAARLLVGAAVFGAVLLVAGRDARAAVEVITGPTPIIDGGANSAGDITVVNEKLAFALAVNSPVPYGVPRGALIDIAPVSGGKIGRDRVVFADFIPNNWAAWPNTYQHVEVVERGAERAVIRAVRDWAQVTVTTEYTLDANSDHVVIVTTLKNESQQTLPNLLSGLTLWPNSGYLFAVPGVTPGAPGAPMGVSAAGALAQRVVAYDEGWSVTLRASGFDHLGDGSMDLYRLHTLAPGASARFEGWLQVGASGDLAPVMRADIERTAQAFGSIDGRVLTVEGRPVEAPVIVVEKHGVPYGWALGHDGRVAFTLPVGRYELYATAKNHTQSRTVAWAVTPGSRGVPQFTPLDGPSRVRFAVENSAGQALDARIRLLSGQKPVVQFLGRSTFFTELEPRGRVEVPLAPGAYRIDVASGGDFFMPRVESSFVVAAHTPATPRVVLTPLYDPSAAGWYSADLHHHADQAEAVTPPADLARSQLAAGLSMLFVSDHDSMANFDALQRIGEQRHVPLLPGMELSPSWGHFNAYPLLPGAKLEIDTSTATVQQIFAEARRLGALVIQANHPFIPYGYLTSVAHGVAPGGFDASFELLELNAAAPGDDPTVMRALWKLWNAGHRYYVSAGTDTHNVWQDESGVIRMFAHVDGPLTAASFARSLQRGHAYASAGPLLYPSVMFGEAVKLVPGETYEFGLKAQSVAGLKRVELIGGGASVRTDEVAGGAREQSFHYAVKPARSTWYAWVVEDRHGRKAYSNPIWLDVLDKTEALP